MLKRLTEQLSAGRALSDDQVAWAVAQLIEDQVTAETKAEFLSALARKGETEQEIWAFARELRDRSIAPRLDPETRGREILDVVGTGGDQLNTFNISTTAAILSAAAGVTVAKHGNRAVTSRSGSADVLEALGIRIELTPDEAARWLHEHRFAFLFAPKYHPAFRHIAPARKLCAARGQTTVFNFLGPLLNPVRPTAQLIGVPRAEWCEPMARVLQLLGVRRGMVVSGKAPLPPTEQSRHWGSLDELSTLGESTIAEFYHDRGFSVSTLAPELFPVQSGRLADWVGGDRQTNAEIVRRILRGEERGPKRDVVLLNAAAALVVAGKAKSLLEGWTRAEELIDQGSALAKLEELVAASR